MATVRTLFFFLFHLLILHLQLPFSIHPPPPPPFILAFP
ncbi:predicted protein [Plenodomus lingam JN3]|uniref:Predicted protein n=1 Tax=Leptosphaeria maculans (strain JN3 / isolate v23.1.3 / race Av1-4-5-6-7-8) TaxID=985895 RepID=E5ABY1_LEPMJ|nr:predicted protein [Plenodomus lingam JN3]CBY01172.1 predicted protein [Plenodomus lingam JN3]